MPSISPASSATKVCTRCGLDKPLAEYYQNKGKRSGYEERCKLCFVTIQADRKPGLAYSPHPHASMHHPERFWAKVEKTEGCWLWTGAKDKQGYGSYRNQNRGHLAHRMAYTLVKGPIPEGLVLDHLCRDPRCVNPDHLEAVTLGENTRRGIGPAKRRAVTHCIHGHPFDEQNTFYTAKGYRQCRECSRRTTRENQRRYRAARKQAQQL